MVVEVLDLKQAGPLQGVVPKPFVAAPQGVEQNPASQKMREHEIRNLQRQLEARFAPMNAQSIISRLGNPLVCYSCMLRIYFLFPLFIPLYQGWHFSLTWRFCPVQLEKI